MRIGIDARPLQTASRFHGVGNVVFNLASALSSVDKTNEYVFFTLRGPNPLPPLEAGFKYSILAIPNLPFLRHLNWIMDEAQLPRYIRASGLDVYLITVPFEISLGYSLNNGGKCRTVAIVHDLTPYKFPKRVFYGKRRLLRPIYLRLLRKIAKADRVVCISESTRKDFLDTIDYPESRVSVIYLGKDESIGKNRDEATMRSFREKYALPEEFILYVGGFAAIKNVMGILEAYRGLVARRPNLMPLVLAGKVNPLETRPLDSFILENDLREHVRFTGFFPQDDLPLLYGAASVFVFPSFYEGFGIPVLEAMAGGAPVVCSGTSSLPEVAGDAALYIDPSKPAEIADAIEKIIDNGELARELREEGFARARKFSWKTCARQFVEVFNERLHSR